MDSKIPAWGMEMHKAFDEIAEKYRLDGKDCITFLAASMSEEFILQKLNEKDAKIILDSIFETYLRVKSLLKGKRSQ